MVPVEEADVKGTKSSSKSNSYDAGARSKASDSRASCQRTARLVVKSVLEQRSSQCLHTATTLLRRARTGLVSSDFRISESQESKQDGSRCLVVSKLLVVACCSEARSLTAAGLVGLP